MSRLKFLRGTAIGMRCVFLMAFLLVVAFEVNAKPPAVVGTNVIPHHMVPTMRYRQPRDTTLAARVQLFVQGETQPELFNGSSPAELLENGQWAWHDMASAITPPPGALTVWTFNGKSAQWGVGNSFQLTGSGMEDTTIDILQPRQWISSVTFLSSDQHVQPDTIVLHVVNDHQESLQISGLRLWLPQDNNAWQILWPQPSLALSTVVPANDRGFVKLSTARLPLTYAALELQTNAGSLWAHLSIKRETFDISGGWVNDHLTQEPYLKLLKHLHVNTGQIESVGGYTDNPSLYDRFPIKLFNRLWPLEQWDTDALLPKIHAVEFLGEPQYGGGKPMQPQEVFDQLLPYRASRLPTTVTLSEERTWRWYAGLSDYPHYDAYRVVAPAADAWREYDRWGGRRIGWGAPLETIGDMCRSLRDLNRPVPCAYWSQGPHHGWGGGFFGGGRSRRSPTPDELRSQAMHALSTRITSLYWFNLSLKSLLKFPDTWEAITRIGREIRMLEPLMLEGDAFYFIRLLQADGSPDWDLATIAAPQAAVLFANDLAYIADPTENVFKFGPPRPVAFKFPLPHWLQGATHVFRVDADGIHEVSWAISGKTISIQDKRTLDAVYVVANQDSVFRDIQQRRQAALDHEQAHPIEREQLEAID
jgi:hypothetical protein